MLLSLVFQAYVLLFGPAMVSAHAYPGLQDTADFPAYIITDSVYISDDLENQVFSSSEFFDTPHLLEPITNYQEIPIEETISNDWIAVVFILCLVQLAIARFFFPGRIRQLLMAVFGYRFFSFVDKEGVMFRETPSYLLIINFILAISLLLLQTLKYFDLIAPWQDTHDLLIFGLIVLFFSGFYLMKKLMLGFLAWIFHTRKATMVYFTNLFLFNQFVGLLILPFIFYHAFSTTYYGLYASWVVVILFNIYKIIRGALLGYRVSGFSVYYLFLYLCGVELAPLLILGKAASVYLFNQ